MASCQVQYPVSNPCLRLFILQTKSYVLLIISTKWILKSNNSQGQVLPTFWAVKLCFSPLLCLKELFQSAPVHLSDFDMHDVLQNRVVLVQLFSSKNEG